MGARSSRPLSGAPGPAGTGSPYRRGDFSFAGDDAVVLKRAFDAIERIPGGWDSLIPEPGERGFMQSRPEPGSVRARVEAAVIASNPGHSGGSFGIVMRAMQGIARFGWDQFVQLYLNAQEYYAQPSAPRQRSNIFDNTPRASAQNGNSPVCAICMENLNDDVVTIDDGTVADGPVRCGHKYHKRCIKDWVNATANPTCPYCRGPVAKIHPAATVGGGKHTYKRKTIRKRYKKGTKRRARR